MGHKTNLPQPLHVATHLSLVGSAALVGYGWYKGKLDYEPTLFIKMAKYGTYGIVLGSQVWNTLISGVTMFKVLPRHQFGEIQKYLLPAYFNVAFVGSAVCLGIHFYVHPFETWTKCERMCCTAITTTMLTSFLNAGPVMDKNLGLMKEMFDIEKENGVGNKAGAQKEDLDELKLKDTKYAAVRKQFGVAHGVSSVLNLMGMVGSFFHLVYLSQHGI